VVGIIGGSLRIRSRYRKVSHTFEVVLDQGSPLRTVNTKGIRSGHEPRRYPNKVLLRWSTVCDYTLAWRQSLNERGYSEEFKLNFRGHLHNRSKTPQGSMKFRV
jgi:hypothetical protein